MDEVGMIVCTFIEGLGKASTCAASRSHRPAPMRYVWHHILPQACGGISIPVNLVQLCDNCHYAVHVLLHQLKLHGVVTPSPLNNRKRIALAKQGYSMALLTGTVDKIPDEGSST